MTDECSNSFPVSDPLRTPVGPGAFQQDDSSRDVALRSKNTLTTLCFTAFVFLIVFGFSFRFVYLFIEVCKKTTQFVTKKRKTFNILLENHSREKSCLFVEMNKAVGRRSRF